MKVPIVSVVMPVYNASRYLDEAIKSILFQSLSRLEFIIVDDGSTDGSKEIAMRHEAEDARIRVISHETNHGNYLSRNEGMAAARGEFIAVMDADDVALSRRLELQVAFLQNRPDHVLIGSQVRLTDPEGAVLGRKPGLLLNHETIDEALMRGKWVIVHPSIVMRKTSVEAAGGYRDRFRTCADQDLYVRLAEIGKVANLSEILLHYRQHYSSLTQLQSDQQYNLHVILQEARERRKLPPLKNEEIPPIKEPTVLMRRDKMSLRYKWAEIALREGHVRSACKNVGYAFALAPAGAMRRMVSLLYRRLYRS